MDAISPAIVTVVRSFLTLLRRAPSSADRQLVYRQLADVLHSSDALEVTVRWLCTIDDSSRKLALELIAVWPASIPASLESIVSDILAQGRFRSGLRARIVESLVRRGGLAIARIPAFLVRSGSATAEEVSARLRRSCADLPEVRAVLRAARKAERTAEAEASAVPPDSIDARHSSCPRCGRKAFVEGEVGPPAAIRREHPRSHRLVAGEIEIELEERFWRPHLSIRIGERVVCDGRELGRSPTRAAWVSLVCLPLCALALAASFAWPLGSTLEGLPTLALLTLAVGLWVRHWRRIPTGTTLPERFVGYVWSEAVVGMTARAMVAEDFAFVYHAVRLLPMPPTDSQRETIRTSRILGSSLVAAGGLAWSWLEPLWQAELADDGSERDRSIALAELLAASWSGELAPQAGERIAAQYGAIYRSTAERVRLRILAIDAMYAVGLEVRDIGELGRDNERVGAIVGSADGPGLARLRWLRQLLPLAPWKKIGTAVSAFEIARRRSDDMRWLSQRPDLLLIHALPPTGVGLESTETILICESGVYYRDLPIDSPQMSIRTVSGAWQRGEGAELRIGPVSWKFPEEPRVLAETLRRWVEWLFVEFLPMADARILRPHSRRYLDRREAGRRTCAFCGTDFVAVAGGVGRVFRVSDR